MDDNIEQLSYIYLPSFYLFGSVCSNTLPLLIELVVFLLLNFESSLYSWPLNGQD